MKVINVVGARPNFMKIAPIIRVIKSFNQTNCRNQTNLSRLPRSESVRGEMRSLFHWDQTNQRNQRNQINQRNLINSKLVHTGQHYDYEMSKVFFEDLEIPEPDIYLGIGSGTHAEQTGRVMIEFEKVLFKEKPDLVMVVGDVNSTLACALAASKIHYSKDSVESTKIDSFNSEQLSVNNPTNSKNSINPMNARGYRPLIAHVEAGLRSFDRTMPEEINRLLTDQISDFLFTPSPDANENLKKEGVPEEKIFLVGNVMVDSLLYNLEKAKKSTVLYRLGLINSNPTNQINQIDKINQTNRYALLTLHRPSNVDNKDAFLRIINALAEISKRIPIIFPIHPRTRKQIEAFGFQKYFSFLELNSINSINQTNQRNKKNQRNQTNQIKLIDPLGYLDFLNLMTHSKFVMTDSGGIQEETTVLGIPCLTLRETTERPITISQGTNVLVWNDTQKIIDEAFKILDGKGKRGNCPELWDGKAAERIVETLVR